MSGPSAALRARVRSELIRISCGELPADQLLAEVAGTLKLAVPFDACFLTGVDPSTMMFMSAAIVEEMPAWCCQPYFDNEFLAEDFNKFAVLAESAEGVATLTQATGGRHARSARHVEINGRLNLEAELRAVFRAGGETWGIGNLVREQGKPDFDAAEIAFVQSVSRDIAEGLRTALLAEQTQVGGADAPGLLMFAADGRLTAATPEAQQWLADLDPVNVVPTALGFPLPTAAYVVVARARALAAGRAGPAARARVRTRSGQWIVLHASCTKDSAGEVAGAALIIDRARPVEVAPLIAAAYQLTPREREIAAYVARGSATPAIAAELHLSPHTVRDHLKAIYEKVGVAGRGEMVARIYTDHYHDRHAVGQREPVAAAF
jgi:DNA-binding CsgD family transcriptional regulator